MLAEIKLKRINKLLLAGDTTSARVTVTHWCGPSFLRAEGVVRQTTAANALTVMLVTHRIRQFS